MNHVEKKNQINQPWQYDDDDIIMFVSITLKFQSFCHVDCLNVHFSTVLEGILILLKCIERRACVLRAEVAMLKLCWQRLLLCVSPGSLWVRLSPARFGLNTREDELLCGHLPQEPAGRLPADPADRQRHVRWRIQGMDSNVTEWL